MSALTFAVPQEYGYVLATATSTLLLSQWHMFFTGGFRRAAKIPYPAPYAPTTTLPSPDEKLSASERQQKEAEYAMNCAVRAHAQFLEQVSIFLPALLISGLRWPVASSVMGALWIVQRIVYAVGYAKSGMAGGKGRLYGGGYLLVQLGLVGMSGKFAWDVIRSHL